MKERDLQLVGPRHRSRGRFVRRRDESSRTRQTHECFESSDFFSPPFGCRYIDNDLAVVFIRRNCCFPSPPSPCRVKLCDAALSLFPRASHSPVGFHLFSSVQHTTIGFIGRRKATRVRRSRPLTDNDVSIYLSFVVV